MARTLDRYGDITGGGGGSADIGARRGAPPISTALAFAVVAGVTVLMWAGLQAIWWVAPGELIWPIAPDVYAIAVFVGVLILILMAARILTVRPSGEGRDRRGRLDALICLPILLYMGLAASAEIAVQAAGFVGVHGAAVPVVFEVVDVDDKYVRGGGRRYLLELRYGAHGRVFDDRVSQAVHDAARAGDTVLRPVETGRFGLQRAMVAAPLRIGDLRHHD